MLVTRSSCNPSLSSACATCLPSPEIAAQTDLPEFVSGSIVIVCAGSTGFINQVANLDRGSSTPRNMTQTAVTPVKIAAVLCSLISLRRYSAVDSACDFILKNTEEQLRPRVLSRRSWRVDSRSKVDCANSSCAT